MLLLLLDVGEDVDEEEKQVEIGQPKASSLVEGSPAGAAEDTGMTRLTTDWTGFGRSRREG